MSALGYYVVFCLVASVLASFFGHDLLRNNPDAITIIVAVITVFAGFLVAIIVVLGDPAVVPDGSWRKAETLREFTENIIIRHEWLFRIYLLSIGVLFSVTLLEKATQVPEMIKLEMRYGLVFLVTLSFLLTLALPRSLSRLQMARWDAEIERRRARDGISGKHD